MINTKNCLIGIMLLLVSLSITYTDESFANVDENCIKAGERKLYEMPRTQVIPIQDSATGRQYELYVKLPENYLKNAKDKYPVIYFTDAVWHVEILSAATEYILENAILVGVSWQKDNNEELVKDVGEHVSRFRDYTTTQSSNPETQAKYHPGQARNHLSFIRNDVIEYVEKHYRTKVDQRTYFGYSLGGEFGAYILLTAPNTFRNYILGSPSFDKGIPYLSNIESRLDTNEKNMIKNVFISYGSLEKDRGEIVEQFLSLLNKRGDQHFSVHQSVIEGSHQSAFPMTGVRSVTWLSTMLEKEGNEVSQANSPELKGPYLGQTLPGLIAEPFAPGFISKEGWELEGSFAPGMKEFFYTTRGEEDSRPTVIGFRQENQTWKKFLEFQRNGEVVLSPDGMRMHMAEGYKDRVGDGWSERKSLGPMFDRKDWGIMRLSASAKGTYVFDDYKSGDVIRTSTIKDGKRQAPIKLGPEVNSGKWTAHPFIAPDESYLIWDSEREGGFGGSDLYISFRQPDGSWGAAINMGDKVNSDKWDAYASVTSDGKAILFNRGIDEENDNVDIYWIDAQIIETLRPESYESD